ncbi:sterol desaturase [Flavobacterium noncentrifugens]|uniref:Sterol desaturase/sphingolipid hydroxylase, fatty acid hydroxylase superfamily n=1 Tax=Flavobacterium noncentrifugens TaxID=1128970 RepID=A0A1G8TCH5_9FLAO|nr:sterol desaturase family protein [Flavobacterium noncentrifugens]GEP50174.1 sterol desaturase [Flavobacterium noncentrifugens]SDJ39279.1 Sterol desaturase/sphingolipid hydroxylase, fatty acid hydroxylase superfamily [Flavobacterium noncentrifugens]
MEHINFLAFAMPAFFLFVYLEFKLAKKRNRPKLFNYESSVSNISIGIAERLLNLFVSATFYGLYYFIYDHYRLFTIQSSIWVWLALILATDFVWYWYHRLGHEVNFFWAAHIVHHHSEEFNFTAAARITTFQAIIRTGFWCILPFIGFHPTMVIVMLVVHGAYSFFTHTQIVGRIKWLEYVFVTPSVHGVHHASDEKYLDKNYGDMFTFWDRMFGTFQEEEEQPKYGLTHPLKSFSFLWQHFHYYFEIYELWKRSRGFKAKWSAVFGSPANMDQDIRPMLERRFLQDRTQKRCRLKFRNYLYVQLGVCVIGLTFLTYYFGQLDTAAKVFATAFILITLINCGALLEQRKWIYYLEYLRLFFVTTYMLYLADSLGFFLFPVGLMILSEQLFSLSTRYQKVVLQLESVK